MIATQIGACFHRGWSGSSGDGRVHLGANHSGALLALALALAVALSGCANVDLDSSQRWFSKPLDLFGRSSGYTYSELQELRKERPITANGLVDGDGACPPLPAAAAAPPPAPSQSASGNPGASAPVSPDAPSLLGEGVALGMSECDVVYRAGQPTAVQLGKNPNGDRTAVLTFSGGPRPGIYRFERGHLMEMDRVAEPPPAPQVKKKPAKPNKRQKHNDQG